MAHIPLPPGVPGIGGPLAAYPETATHLLGLAQALLRGPSSLSSAEREMIAAYVSCGNECVFCTNSHAAAARHLLGPDGAMMDALVSGMKRCAVEQAPVGDKMRALLGIADKVRSDARSVGEDDVARARECGADDQAIHDTVLIAAAFCMFNRYVDGLATLAPSDPDAYLRMGAALAQDGYGSRAR